MTDNIKFSFSIPTQIYFARNAISNNSDIFGNYKRAFIVTGKHSGRLSGALDDVIQALTKNQVEYYLFEGIENNPDVVQCHNVGKLARDFKADVIIGIGGGSPLDASKAIAVFAANDITCERLFQYGYDNGVLPIIAVPTTSGTGSEVTPWSVMTRHDRQTKLSFGGSLTFPRYAFLDPKYTDALPDRITLDTAMDAFTHCFESIISLKATPITDALNIHALKLFSKCMDAIDRYDFSSIRDELMLVSMLGGITISQTGTTIMHAMGYPLTYFHGIPHGAANSYVLPVYLNTLREFRSDRLDVALDALNMNMAELTEFALRHYSFNIELSDSMIEKYSYQTSLQGSAKNTGIPCEPKDIEKMYAAMRAV